jgi:hypothetical protein
VSRCADIAFPSREGPDRPKGECDAQDPFGREGRFGGPGGRPDPGLGRRPRRGGGGGSFISPLATLLFAHKGVGTEDGLLSIDAMDAVPEPGAWTLMLLGFGAAGAALRARRRTSAGRAAV